MKRKALICIDMQNDFLLPTSPLCVAGGLTCLPHVKDAIAAAHAHADTLGGVQVIYVVRSHCPSGHDVEYTRAPLFRDGVGIVMKGTRGEELAEGLGIVGTDKLIIKTRFSAFHQTSLDGILRRLEIKDIILCGVQTPNCIRATAFDAMALDYRVTVLSDATASRSPDAQAANLEDMHLVGIQIKSTAEWMSEISSEMPMVGQAEMAAATAASW